MSDLIFYGILSVLGLIGGYFFIFGEVMTPPDRRMPRRSTGDLGPGVGPVHSNCATCTCKYIDPTGRI